MAVPVYSSDNIDLTGLEPAKIELSENERAEIQSMANFMAVDAAASVKGNATVGVKPDGYIKDGQRYVTVYMEVTMKLEDVI